ncbi:hypothetical protein N7448_011011 [Penicillium atrosanguineum]|nr:hypothetical protein N7448_011011 [Penicillium atrosanguineum]
MLAYFRLATQKTRFVPCGTSGVRRSKSAVSMGEFGFTTKGHNVVAAFEDQVQGKTFAITGPSEGGIGGQIAMDLAKASPARLILFGRSLDRTKNVIDAINLASKTPVQISFIEVMLESLASVRKAAREVTSDPDIKAIDGIVNNAGIMSLPNYTASADGLEMQLAVNHLSHFLLTNLLMPKLLAAEHPRVVNLSSYGHRLSAFRFDDPLWSDGATYDRLYAYAQSKTANVLFSVSLNQKLWQKSHLRSYAVDPGSVATKLARHMDSEGWSTGLEYFSKHGITRPGRKSAEEGVAGPLRALLQPDLATEAGVYMTDTQLTVDPEVIKPYAADPEEAEKLWKLSEDLVGQNFVY